MNIDKEEKVRLDCGIAYFMGWRIDNSFPDKDRVWRNGNHVELDTTFKFSQDWNVLQEVVEKIESLGFNFYTHQARTLIDRNDIGLMAGLETPEIEIRSSVVDFDKKLSTYMAASKFVKWYNELQIKNNAKQTS